MLRTARARGVLVNVTDTFTRGSPKLGVIWLMSLLLPLLVLGKGVSLAGITEIPSLPAKSIVSLFEPPFPVDYGLPFPFNNRV